MFELTINGKVYPFNFGFGFLKEVNKRVAVPVEGLPDVKKNLGVQYLVASIMDRDIEALEEVLYAANKGLTPRVTAAELDQYIEETELDALFDDVLDLLTSANCTKKAVQDVKTLMANAEEKAKEKN